MDLPEIATKTALNVASVVLKHAATAALTRALDAADDDVPPMYDARGEFVLDACSDDEGDEDPIPGAFKQLTWRFEPVSGLEQLADCDILGERFYEEVCGISLPDLATRVTWRAASLSATLAAAPHGIAAQARAALAPASSGSPSQCAAGIDCIKCPKCVLRRARGLNCGLPECNASAVSGTPLKVCARCRVVAYCCREHQRSDWARHKAAECTKIDAAAPRAL